MEDKALKYPRGTILALETGEYSDFTYCGILLTTQDIDLFELGEAYKEAFHPQWPDDTPRPEDFPSWLVANGYAAPVDYSSVHVGSYGSFDLGGRG